MAEPITLQKLVSADADADTLGEFANEDKMVVSRKGLEYPSAPMASRLVVENGLLGATPFSTYAAMTASALVDGDYAIVTNDSDLVKNGVYQKNSGNYVYVKYNVQAQLTNLKNQIDTDIVTPIRGLYNDLNNPLMSVKIKLVGDSITWGVGASGASSSTPRTGRLTDPRNTTDASVSPSWANLLNQYLLSTYTDSQVTRVAPAIAYAEANNNMFFSRDADFFKFTDTLNNRVLSSGKAREAASVVSVEGGEWFSLYSKGYPAGDVVFDEISFEANGVGFELVYTKLKKTDPTGGIINIYIDDAFYKKINFFDTAGGYNFREFITLPNDGKHNIKIRNESTVAAIAKLQYIKATKRVTVANDGISGSTTNSWLTVVKFDQSIEVNDDYIFIMLGTNDRIKSANNSEIGFANNLSKMIDDAKLITNNKAKIIMMSASAVTNDENPLTSNFFMTMRAVNNTINNIAESKNLSFISNYTATQQAKIDGVSFLSDGLHPNDFGHRAIFENIKDAVVNN